MTYDYASLIDVGHNRINNEDAVRLHPETGLAVLADGMGGYNAGEVASAMAVTLIGEALSEWSKTLDRAQCRIEQLHAVLDLCVERVNTAIYAAACETPEFAGMGTTLVMGMFDAERVVLAHIGDSRAYLWRDQQLTQLTKDHSVLQEQIDMGLITPEQAKSAAYKNLITRALGVTEQVELDIMTCQPQPDDVFLLCSDGLSDMLTDDDMAQQLALPIPLQARAKSLVDAANAAGGRDNIAVVLVQAKPPAMFADTQPT